MNKYVALGILFTVILLAGCTTTEYKAFEGKNNVVDGQGGTRVIVDGMDIWDNGEPPRKFKVLGIIDDERPGGGIFSITSQLRSDMVKKAREAGGDAIIQLNNQSRIVGSPISGPTPSIAYGNTVPAYGAYGSTMPASRNFAKYAVIKYFE